MLVTFSDNFLKTQTRHGLNLDKTLKNLKDYANFNGFDEETTIYSFVIKSLRKDLFFNPRDEGAFKELLYISIFWAGLHEFRASKQQIQKKGNKTRKIQAKDIKVSSNYANLYTSIQSEVIYAIYRNFTGFQLKEKIELYMLIFYECNCIQRDRKKHDI